MNRYTSLFVLGNPRSGTSLLRIMLDNHAKISIPPESGYIQWWSEKYGDWSHSDSLNEDKVNSFITDLASSRKIETWKLNYGQLQSLIFEVQPNNYMELSQAVILQYAGQNDKRPLVMGDKNNYYLQHLDVIKKYFSKAKFLAIIRDGRDVACSYQGLKYLESDSPYKPVLPSSIPLIAEEWNKNNKMILDYFSSLQDHQHLWIRYEDLVINTEETLGEVCDFLGLDFDSQMLEYYKTENEPLETIAWKKKTKKKPDANNIGKYKVELSERDIQKFEKESKSILTSFNYKLRE